MRFKSVISEMLFPDGIKCIICSRELKCKSDICVCDKCVLPYINKRCLRCGRQVSNLAEYCETCINYPVAFDKARSCFVFEGDIKALIYRFKYGNERYLAYYLAKFLQKTYLAENFQADIITYVPLHPKRQKKRGYNQSELLANALSKMIDVPAQPLLLKNKHTKNMARLNAAARRELIKGTFSFFGEPSEVRRKKVLLIDDIFTTGSTANECTRVLQIGKPECVNILTVASLPVKIKINKSVELKDIKTYK